MAVSGGIRVSESNSSWFTSEVQSLQGQMAALQAALECSKHAVEAFHRRAAENLQASEQRYQDLFNSVLTGVYRIAPTGEILLANPALVRLLGYDTLRDASDHRLTPPPELFPARAPQHVLGAERTWVRRTGEKITVRESCRAVRDEDGAVVYFEGVVEDITGHKKAELFEHDCRQLLERVARNESLGVILSELAVLVHRQTDAGCAVLLMRDGKLQSVATKGMPAGSHFQVTVLDTASSKVGAADGARAIWVEPIMSGKGEMLGALASHRPHTCLNGRPEHQIMETASRLAGVAIEHHQLYQDLEQQATRDRLTGLPNRMAMEDYLGHCLEQEKSAKLALFWIDLDRFKEINDTLGHSVGDDLIKQVASRLASVIDSAGLLARTGGDEFAVILPARTDSGFEAAARRMLDAIHEPFQLNGFELFVTGSIGIAIYPDHGTTAAELQRNADSAMYRAKNQGRNAFAFHEPALSGHTRDRMELASSLRRALERDELRLHYQPQIDLEGRIRGFEALVRWQHSGRGLLAPAQFIDIAEETGLIVPIGTWVIEEACRQAVTWNQGRAEPLTIAVNVSPLQFYFSDLVEAVQTALERAACPPEYLELELTETLVVRDTRKCAEDLERLRALGVTIAIDDFGTGYSSLSYLQRLPVDVLKVDRSFLENVGDTSNADGSRILEAVTMLAHSLGLRIVAEGIERPEQMEVLHQLGIDLAQGYLIGKPAPPQDAETALRQPHRPNAIVMVGRSRARSTERMRPGAEHVGIHTPPEFARERSLA